jgi:hypothetical protein
MWFKTTESREVLFCPQPSPHKVTYKFIYANWSLLLSRGLVFLKSLQEVSLLLTLSLEVL